jgi:predicted XRE-type DNA-binding protein
MNEEITATGSTGNVFLDLEIDEAEELLVKAQLAARISSIIEHRHISQQEAASVLGTTQPTVSRLVRGELYGFDGSAARVPAGARTGHRDPREEARIRIRARSDAGVRIGQLALKHGFWILIDDRELFLPAQKPGAMTAS